jgi:diguanylate cyclase (GGDEF)-like protein
MRGSELSAEKKRDVTYEREIESDPELVLALLDIYRHLELGDLFELLLRNAAKWSAAAAGVAWGLSENRRTYIPLAGTMPADDPRFKAYARIEPSKVKSWLAEGPQVFSGLGPFGEIEGEWPDGTPEFSIAMPVTSQDSRWAGVLLLVLSSSPDETLMERLTRLSEMAKPAVGNALQLLSMRELIIKDDTASCYNRRHFEEFLPEELARASRFRAPVSLIFLDLDNLKDINKQHGHAMGSRTLYEVSVRVRSKIRKFDKLFRYGGDEFCIVLPETEWHGAMEVAERVRRSIAEKAFLVRELGRDCVRMTASLGIASFPLHARTQKELIAKADRAMQAIKNGSKNAIGISEIEGNGNGN